MGLYFLLPGPAGSKSLMPHRRLSCCSMPHLCFTPKAACLQRSSGTSTKEAFWEIVPYLLLTIVGR